MIAIEETATVQPNGQVVLVRPELQPGSKVKVIILLQEPQAPVFRARGQPGSFFDAVRNLKLDGPSDWSEHLDDYLYHGKHHGGE